MELKIKQLEELKNQLAVARKNKDHANAIRLWKQCGDLTIEIYGKQKVSSYGSRAGRMQQAIRSAK